MSILSELKKLTGKQNAKVVSEALPPVVPTPTFADSGKFLGVNENGEYELGSNRFAVTLNEVTSPITADKTASEIYAACIAGKTIVINRGSMSYYPMYISIGHNGALDILFGYTEDSDNFVHIHYNKNVEYPNGHWEIDET